MKPCRTMLVLLAVQVLSLPAKALALADSRDSAGSALGIAALLHRMHSKNGHGASDPSPNR